MRTSHLERFVAVPVVLPPNQNPPGIDPLPFILLAVALGAALVAMPVMRRRRANGAAARAHPPPHEVVLEPGTAYLLLDVKPDRAFRILESQLARGAKGLVVSRIYPDEVRRRYRLKDVPVLWLSRGYGKDAVNPTNLGAIIQNVEKFVSGKEDSVVLFDGLEYLLVQNDAQKVVKFVQTLADTASVHHAKVLIPFDTKSVSEVQRALITRDLQTL
jgi:two-component system cell cycle response regulator